MGDNKKPDRKKHKGSTNHKLVKLSKYVGKIRKELRALQETVIKLGASTAADLGNIRKSFNDVVGIHTDKINDLNYNIRAVNGAVIGTGDRMFALIDVLRETLPPEQAEKLSDENLLLATKARVEERQKQEAEEEAKLKAAEEAAERAKELEEVMASDEEESGKLEEMLSSDQQAGVPEGQFGVPEGASVFGGEG